MCGEHMVSWINGQNRNRIIVINKLNSQIKFKKGARTKKTEAVNWLQSQRMK